MVLVLSWLRSHTAINGLLFAWIISTALIGGAWFFELVIGLAPCALCLEQRLSHYLIIVLSPVIILLIHKGALNRYAIIFSLLLMLMLALWTGGLGGYHAGVEWRFWEGPSACSGGIDTPLPQSAEELMAALALPDPVSCGDVAWSFLGISLAGYNVLFSGLIILKLGLTLKTMIKIKNRS